MTEGPSDLPEVVQWDPEIIEKLERARTRSSPWTPAETQLEADVIDELLEAGLIESVDGGFRLTDPGVVESPRESANPQPPRLRGLLRSNDRSLQFSIGLSLLLVVLLRVVPFRDVYRGGAVVLSSNDPYYYRYLVERLSAAAAGPFDLGVLGELPGGVAHGEPLMVAANWWVTELLGGGPAVAGHVLAWYPVVSAVITGLLVYLVATYLSDDYRVGLVAVGLLAITPGHVFRTSIGFADHHAFDYPWLVLTLLCFLVLIDHREGTGRPWLPTLGLGIGLAGQTLAWEAGPLLIVPLGLCVAAYAPLALRAGHDPVPTLGPLAVGTGFGAAVTLLAHLGFGWHTRVVAAAPGLIFLGSLAVLVVAVVVYRFELPWPTIAGLEALGGLVVVVVLPIVLPDLVVGLNRGIATLTGTTGIAETGSVIGAWGPVIGPVIMLGFAPFLGLPVTVWAIDEAVNRHRFGWLALSLYIWYFLGLSLIQRRFVGELAPLLAVAGGLGFLYLASWLDLISIPTPFKGDPSGSNAVPQGVIEPPDRQRLTILAGIALVFGGFSSLFSGVIQSRTTIDPRSYAAARWIAEYADRRDMAYPESYVLSEWGRNRMFNYFVNGESGSYGFARQNYGDFLLANEPTAWYERLEDRVGFVVVQFLSSDLRPSTMYSRLFNHYGSATGRVNGVSHYRALFTSGGGHTKVFSLVPGATVSGTGPSNADLTMATEVDIPGARFTYTKRTTTDADGTFAVTVPHPGQYTLEATEQLTTVRVSEAAVVEGLEVTA